MLGIHEKSNEKILHTQIFTIAIALIIIGLTAHFSSLSVLVTVGIEFTVLICGTVSFVVSVINMRGQEKRLEQAAIRVNHFLAGDNKVRLESSDEGSLAKFFEEINHMAMSLQTHLEKEKDSKEFLKSMIADISHQLKTPIAAIRMYNEIIAGEADNPTTVSNFTQKTERSLDRVECLIQNLLKITKLDAGTIVLEKRQFEVNTLLEDVKEEFQTIAEQEGKKIVIDDSCETVLLLADRNWTAECVRNLVQNALVHMKSGDSVQLSCDSTPVLVRIVVSDNGSGIHPEDIHHIFKRFYRSRFSQDSQGVGLGLSLVKSILEAQGGTVSVKSTLGEGSTFYLDFPSTF